MAGAYAHITVVNHAQKIARNALRTADVKYALAMNLRYAELGAVSPDYPYLAIGQSQWADDMHYTNNSALLRSGISHLQQLAGVERERATGWLFGFASHMATDMTIHPVVEKLVGPYKGHEGPHRQCEMHQDTFIFQKMDLGDVGLTEHLKSGIASCNDGNDAHKLDPAISDLWLKMLADTYPVAGWQVRPDPDEWHLGFAGVLGAVNASNRLFPFARHVATNLNLTYPALSEVENRYILNLQTPEVRLDYEKVFERACQNVVKVWCGLEDALTGTSRAFLDGLKNWDLDTGKTVPDGRYVFWTEAV
jgi:hypothetical protein